MKLSILKAVNAKPIAPAAVEGEIDPRYPRNNRGQPEFGSVILTLDHLLANSSDFHVHQKAVYSTQTPRQALVALLTDYYPKVTGTPAPLLDNATFEVLKALDEDPAGSIALYFVPAIVTDRLGGMIVQVVLSQIALQRLVAHPDFGDGSSLLAMNGLVNAVTDLSMKAIRHLGEVPALMLMQLDEPRPAIAEANNPAG